MSHPRGVQLRRIGWLLTPLLVWAASFLGAWAGAAVGGLGWMVGGAVGASLVTIAVWATVLRRHARRAAERSGAGETEHPEVGS